MTSTPPPEAQVRDLSPKFSSDSLVATAPLPLPSQRSARASASSKARRATVMAWAWAARRAGASRTFSASVLMTRCRPTRSEYRSSATVRRACAGPMSGRSTGPFPSS